MSETPGRLAKRRRSVRLQSQSTDVKDENNEPRAPVAKAKKESKIPLVRIVISFATGVNL